MKTKGIFAVIQILAAIVLAVSSLVFYIRVCSLVEKEYLGNFADAAESYRVIADSGREIYSQAYATIPQHRQTLDAACQQIDKLKKRCKQLKEDLPHQIDDWPEEVYKPVGEIRKSLVMAIDVLNSFDMEKHQQVLNAFEQTSQSLKTASGNLRRISMQIRGLATLALILLLALSVNFVINGWLLLLPDSKKQE